MRGTVLLVEDRELLRSALRTFLELEGWEALESTSAQEARTLLPFCDVLLTDLVLHGSESGDAWLMSVRRSFPDLPIIVMSGSKVRIPAGIHPAAVLTKPFDLGELSHALRAAVG